MSRGFKIALAALAIVVVSPLLPRSFSDLVPAIGGIAFLLVLVGCIPYSVWVAYTAFKRRWKRVGIQITIPLITFLALWAILSAHSKQAYFKYLSTLYDAEVTLTPALYEYNSSRGFNGDGYSFSVYELPAKIRSRFESADERLLSEFPKRPEYRERWISQHWKEAPFDLRFEKHLDFALGSYETNDRLSPHFQAIRKALSHKRTYYAFFVNVNRDHIADIDFFIVDLEGGRLYIINQNT